MNGLTMCPVCKRRQGWDGHPYAPCSPPAEDFSAEALAEFAALSRRPQPPAWARPPILLKKPVRKDRY